MHREVPVKVNAFVDEGVAPLVEALSAVDGLVTLDSCEADGGGNASIFFTYGSSWLELAEMAERIAAAVRALDLCCGSSVRVEWMGSNDRPHAQVLTRPEHVAAVARGITDALLGGGQGAVRPSALVGREGVEVMFRNPEQWDRIGWSSQRDFEPRLGWSSEPLVMGMIRRRAFGTGIGGFYWMKFRPIFPARPNEGEDDG